MKILVQLILLLIGVVASVVVAVNRNYGFEGIAPGYNRFVPNAIIQQLFEMIRTVIKNGNSEKDTPILDPFIFENADFGICNNIFSLEANFFNGTVTGLGDFQILQSKFTKEDITIDLQVNFPRLVFESDNYEMDGNVKGAFILAGKGKFYVEVYNFTLSTNVYLMQSSNEKSILIKQLENPRFTVEKIKSSTEFDNNFDDILNAMVDDMLAEYLSRFDGYLAKKYILKIPDYINPFLDKFESWRFIIILLNKY